VVRAPGLCPEGPGFDPLEAPRLSRAGETHAHLRGSFFRQLRRIQFNSKKNVLITALLLTHMWVNPNAGKSTCGGMAGSVGQDISFIRSLID